MKAFNYNGQRNVSGERIRQARTRQRCISRIENGLRMVQDFELRAIAEALGVTTGWLVGETEDQKNFCSRL